MKPSEEKILLVYEPEKISKHFSTNHEFISYLLLEIMLQKNCPIGAWTLKNQLDLLSVETATATIGRILKVFDNKQYCYQVSNKGRKLTKVGIDQVIEMRKMIEKAELSNNVASSVEIKHYDDLIELLYTRLIIEREAVALAAFHATDDDIANMDAALRQHRMFLRESLDDSHMGLDFHITMVDASHNKFISAVSRLLAFEEHQIEACYPSLTTRSHAIDYIDVHQNIRDAIAAHNKDQAVALLEEHLKEIIELVRKDRLRF